MTSPDEGPTPGPFSDTLIALGFSQYEARCYVGLLGPEPQTGYAVAKATGVPQPKVYEVLRKLAARGAARQVPGRPVRFAAIPPGELLDSLETTFDERIDSARAASARLDTAGAPPEQEPVTRLADRAVVLEAAGAAMAEAGRRVYLSATSLELRDLKPAVVAAAGTGVDIVVLCFGRMPFQVAGVRTLRHASTDGALFRHHQSRHVALVADSRRTVFGLAADGQRWAGITTTSEIVSAAVKGYIRHDLDLQQVFDDFGPQLIEAYGPGLQRLESYRADQPPSFGRGTDVRAG